MFMGSFRPNGSSAVSASNNKGSGFSVTRTGVGTFSLVLRGLGGRQVVSAVAHLRLNASANSVAQVGAITLSGGNATVVVRTLTAGTDADIADNANNVVSFMIVVA